MHTALLMLALASARPPQAPAPPQAPIASASRPCNKQVCDCGCKSGETCTCADADGWFYSPAHGHKIRYVWLYEDGSKVPCKPGETCAPPKAGTRPVKEAPPTFHAPAQHQYHPFTPRVISPSFGGSFSRGGGC